jgi:putative membrane protein
MEFFLRLAVKLVLYFALLLAAMALALLPAGVLTLLWAALALALVNTLLRPLLVIIALPFNVFTWGITSVFANLLTLVIALAIAGLTGGFWALLLIALLVMLTDDAVRLVRQAIHKKGASVRPQFLPYRF